VPLRAEGLRKCLRFHVAILPKAGLLSSRLQRLRLYDVRTSSLPSTIGLCASDLQGIAEVTNTAQRRLLYCKEAAETGWYGGWAEVRFNVSRTNPFVTFDNSVARLEYVDICQRPVDLNNQFVEYLRYGSGRLPKLFAQGHCGCFAPQVYTRNNVPTFVDLTNPPQFIAAYATDPTDIGKRVLMQGTDNNNNVITSQDLFQRAQGQFESLTSPFIQWPMQFNSITGIQKDITNGPVQIFQVDPTSGNQVLLVTMQGSEQTAWYRRYFFHSLPFNCCTFTGPNPCSPIQPVESVQVHAIVKLEFIPVQYDTDYCLIQNLEALKQEAMAVRYSSMDSTQSKQLEAQKHREAVRYLNGELNHYEGSDHPAIQVSVFGSARLEHQMIGTQV
jgi:hypothetical protein